MTDNEKQEKKLNVYQRIANAGKEIGTFEKDGENKHFKFKYAGIESVIAKVRPICANHGISIIQGTTGEMKVLKKDAKNFLTNLTVRTRVTNLDDPSDFIEVETHAQGYDHSDKGAFQAESGGRKNAIFGIFCVHAGTNEADSNEGHAPARQPARQPAPAQQTQQAYQPPPQVAEQQQYSSPVQPPSPVAPVAQSDEYHPLFIESGEAKTSSRGNPMVVAKCVVTNGPYVNKKFSCFLTFGPGFALNKATRFVQCSTGKVMPPNNDPFQVAAMIQGCSLMAKLKTEQYTAKDGSSQEGLDINGMEMAPITTAPSAATHAPVQQTLPPPDNDLEVDEDIMHEEDFM